MPHGNPQGPGSAARFSRPAWIFSVWGECSAWAASRLTMASSQQLFVGALFLFEDCGSSAHFIEEAVHLRWSARKDRRHTRRTRGRPSERKRVKRITLHLRPPFDLLLHRASG